MTTLRETMQDAFQEVCDQWSIYDEQTMGPIQMQVQVLTNRIEAQVDALTDNVDAFSRRGALAG